MARTDNLDRDPMRDLLRRVRALEKATPLNNASIGRNGLRVHDGGVITIENGGLKITGTAEVIGELIGSGVLTWTGETSLEGPTTVTGALGINGPTTLEGNLSLAGGGQINIGSAVVLKGGVISGATVQIVGTSVIILSGDSQVLGTLLVNGAATLQSAVVQNGLSVGGAITNAGMSLKTGVTPNVYVDGAGKIWRTS